ncbi:MAG: manganese efflux pump MntP family protein [Candidatus Diapherotrites archaeon]
MDFFSLFLVAFALAMDCLAVCLAAGISTKKVSLSQALKTAFLFGFFQAVMPLLGWLAGIKFLELIRGLDHWIAFLVLSIIGVKMALESRKKSNSKKTNYFENKVLFFLAVATSIDALAVGLSLAFVGTNIFFSVLLIGITTFFVSLGGIAFGKKASVRLKSRAEILGGIILIAIGARIVLEHSLTP